MLRALSLAALVLLCSATSLLAQERQIATYGGVSGSSAAMARGGPTHIREVRNENRMGFDDRRRTRHPGIA